VRKFIAARAAVRHVVGQPGAHREQGEVSLLRIEKPARARLLLRNVVQEYFFGTESRSEEMRNFGRAPGGYV